MNFNPGPEFAGYFMAAIALFWVLVVIVHCAFAAGVFADASERRGLRFVGAGIWTLATLLGGVFVAGVYWMIHCSTLNPGADGREADPTRTT